MRIQYHIFLFEITEKKFLFKHCLGCLERMCTVLMCTALDLGVSRVRYILHREISKMKN